MTGKLPIPSAALAQHVIALGKTGSGKSSKLRVIVEHLLEGNRPVCIIDPKGDWWGLKSSADGRQSGFPIVIFGGEHADVPLNPHAGAAVAELVATGNRSCLIDLGGWMVGERTRFFIDFAAALFKHARGARHLVIDEVHNFAPKGKVFDVDAGKALHWANRLASEGRGKGLTLIAASQRPQKVHNDFLTSCETLIAGRVIHKADRDAIKDWIDGCADPAKGREVLAELAGMKRAEAWVWSPEIEFGPARITFPMFQTYDSFKPQGADQAKLKGWAEVDLDEVKTKLAAVVAEAQAKDPAILQRRIAELQRDLAAAKRAQPTPAGTTQEELRIARAQGIDAGRAQVRNEIQSRVVGVGKAIEEALLRQQGLLDVVERIEPVPIKISKALVTSIERHVSLPAAAANPIIGKRIAPQAAPRSRVGNGELPPVAYRVLNALAELEQMGAASPARELVAFMAGYSHLQSTGFVKAMGSLRTAGMIDYPPGGGTVVITDTGRAAADPPVRPSTAEELQERIVTMLGGATGRILRPLIAAYPKALDRNEVAAAAGYNHLHSTGFVKAIGRLRTLGFIDYPDRGTVVAKPVLFLE